MLITENAQYFNAVNGPSGIIHTEAKKLQEWGTRLIDREGAAVAEEASDYVGVEEASTPLKKTGAAKGGKFNIRIKKLTSPHSSAAATPRTSTPSRLNQEIKMEDDDEEDRDENESEEDFDTLSDMGTSSGRGASVSMDGFGTPGARGSPETVRKYIKRATGPRAPYTHKKNRLRASAVTGLLSTPRLTNGNAEDGEGRPFMAPVSSTSGAVAAAIPLLYSADGSIDLDRLTEDERRALLRPADLDDWPDLLVPFVQSVLPLHTDVQPHAQTLTRPIKDVVDGFGSSILRDPTPISQSFSYNVDNLALDQQKSPFAISSGHVFEQQLEAESIPLAWPRPTNLSSSTNSASAPSPATAGDNSGAPIRTLKGRDREKEREAAGAGNLDDWTFPRAHLAKLLEPLDLGLYPGLLPAAWINHIRSSKGGPAKSRLPPFHLSMGPTFENALQDELTSMPYRVLLNGKPGVINSNAAQADTPTADVCTAMSQAASRDWTLSSDEEKRAGVRGSDVIREAVYGGVLGEAYASSVFDFVCGAAKSVQDRRANEEVEQETEERQSIAQRSSPVRAELPRVVPSYFDEAGEMLDTDGYIGMSMIPLDVRKEAGLSGRPSDSRKGTPGLGSEPSGRGKKRVRSRDVSLGFQSKWPRVSSTSAEENVVMKKEDESEMGEGWTMAQDGGALDCLASAYASGAILEKGLVDYVRDSIISPLTGGKLDLLVRVGEEVARLRGHAQESDEKDIVALVDHVGSLANDLSQILQPLETPKELRGNGMVDVLAKKMLSGSEYRRNRWQVAELSRAKDDVVELEALVRTKEEMLNEMQQTDSNSLTLPVRWTSMDMDSEKASRALEQYAAMLQNIAARREKAGTDATEGETLNRLRLAYIALAKLAPTRELSRGQWAAWAEYLQQQMAQQKQQQQQQQQGQRSV